jgi:hypothetical protein
MFSLRQTTSALGVAACGVALLGAIAHAPPPPPPPIRPAVTLVLEMPSRTYRAKLRDPDCTGPCATLLQQLKPGVRAALDNEFPFIVWTPGADGASRDTIAVIWQNDPTTSLAATRIEFRLRGPRGSDSTRATVSFENADTVTLRADRDWQPDRLAAIWLKQIPAKLQRKDLVPLVFGRVPLAAKADFTRDEAMVRAHPESLKADPNDRPGFELTVSVKHGGIDDDGILNLPVCSFGTGRILYSCAVSAIDVKGGRKLTGPELRAALVAPNAVKARETRLISFKACAGCVQLSGPADQ